MADNSKTNVYNAMLWLYESNFNDSGDLSTGVREDQVLNIKQGGKVRVKYLTESAREAISAKQNRPLDQVPTAVLEYATPEALAEFKASKDAAKGAAPAKSNTKATATRF